MNLVVFLLLVITVLIAIGKISYSSTPEYFIADAGGDQPCDRYSSTTTSDSIDNSRIVCYDPKTKTVLDESKCNPASRPVVPKTLTCTRKGISEVVSIADHGIGEKFKAFILSTLNVDAIQKFEIIFDAVCISANVDSSLVRNMARNIDAGDYSLIQKHSVDLLFRPREPGMQINQVGASIVYFVMTKLLSELGANLPNVTISSILEHFYDAVSIKTAINFLTAVVVNISADVIKNKKFFLTLPFDDGNGNIKTIVDYLRQKI